MLSSSIAGTGGTSCSGGLRPASSWLMRHNANGRGPRRVTIVLAPVVRLARNSGISARPTAVELANHETLAGERASQCLVELAVGEAETERLGALRHGALARDHDLRHLSV